MILLKTLVTILVWFEFISSIYANEVIGCGGFIKSNTEINYKIIKVKLLTKEGIVKYTTEASPVNGYYMIPVYTKGEYILQVNPPLGWSFEPNEIPVNVDGETDACSKNEDINFFFKGFGLSGKVVTNGDIRMNGPAGVKLNLISNNKVIDTKFSAADGTYYFSNAMPGAYQIEAEHETIQFLTKKVSVVLSKENWSSKDNIVVSGYKLEGLVKTFGGTPVPNVFVYLHFNDNSHAKIDTKKFGCDSSSRSDLRICHIKTDATGKFSFSNIAYGKYKLTASLEMENALFKFSMKPESINADLTKHQDVVLSDTFKLEKVTVVSQALLKQNGKPIENGQVYINGEKLSKDIGRDGKFEMTLVSGKYKIQVKSNNVYFAEHSFNLDLSNFDTTKDQYSELRGLKTFVANSFDVCGQVSVIKDQNINNLYKSIKINAYMASNMKLVRSMNLEKNLQYCMVLNTDTSYVVKAELTDQKLAKILKLVPFEKKITVSDKPIMNVNFGQLEAKLDGKLVLLPNPNQPLLNDLVITIKSEDSNQAWSKDIAVKCEVSGSELVCKFSLKNLLFGDYLISTNYDDLFCWKEQKTLSIDSENQAYTLTQLGFVFNYELSHKNALLKVNDLTREIKSRSDLKGYLCLPQAKDYQLVIESCHKYTEAAADYDKIQLSQSLFKRNANTIVLKATRVQVDFEVIFNDDSPQNIKSEDLYVEAVGQDQKVEKISFKLEKNSQTQLVFSGRGWFKPNQKMRFTAKSNKILFEESLKSLRINEDNCDLNKVNFQAKLGIFIIGTVNPNNLENIALTLSSTSDEKEVLDKTLIKNTFKLGPLKAPYTLYDVELIKSGYLFTKKLIPSKSSDTVEYVFNAEKLGQLKVDVVDKKLGVQLENVLLSLSSENRQFRQNHKTDSNGETSFENLKPGLYYLIVMMQEYEFQPNSHPIRISDGDHTSIKINAERTAYSCIGKVTSINGQSENGIVIEAVGIYNTANADANNCAQSQESDTVEDGFYRIYNLKPMCEYTLSLKNLGKEFKSRVIPESYGFTVGESNVADKDFVLVDPIEKIDVTVSVSLNKGLKNPLTNAMNYYVKVKLFKMDQPDSVIQTQMGTANSVQYFNQLPRNSKQQYSVQISLLASSTVYNFGSLTQQQQMQLNQLPVIESMELGFISDSAHKHLSAKFDFTKKNTDFFDQDHGKEQYQNFYMTLPLFIVIVGILLNSKSVQKQIASFRGYVEQRGGIVKAAQYSFHPPQLQNMPKSPRTKSQRSKKQITTDSSANESDIDRSSRYATRQQTNEIDNYDIINNEDVMDMQLTSGRKQRVKKVD